MDTLPFLRLEIVHGGRSSVATAFSETAARDSIRSDEQSMSADIIEKVEVYYLEPSLIVNAMMTKIWLME